MFKPFLLDYLDIALVADTIATRVSATRPVTMLTHGDRAKIEVIGDLPKGLSLHYCAAIISV